VLSRALDDDSMVTVVLGGSGRGSRLRQRGRSDDERRRESTAASPAPEGRRRWRLAVDGAATEAAHCFGWLDGGGAALEWRGEVGAASVAGAVA
jgi:hypothetical protein